jgi:hypothetical protein
MFKMLVITLFIGSTAYALPTIPEGQYEGKANWKDDSGKKGQYTVSATVKGEDINAKYLYSTGKATYEIQTKSTTDGFFDVLMSNKKVGEGYCLSVQCHYTAQFGNVKIEESLTFWQGHLYRVGSKNINGTSIAWEEALKAI